MNEKLAARLNLNFGLSEAERAIRERYKLEQKALSSLALEAEMPRHWMKRVRRVPKEKLDKRGKQTAMSLAEAARLTAEGDMDVRASVTALAEDAGIDYDTFKDRLIQLQELGLIRIEKLGSGNGRPSHIRLNISDDHYREIKADTERSIGRHLQIQEERIAIIGATYLDTG